MAKKAIKKTSSSSFLKSAIGHHEALKLIYPSVGSTRIPDNAVFFAFYNVFGFALELYFKAFLSSKAKTIEELSQYPYSHNLKNLLDACKELSIFDYHGRPDVDPSAIEKIVSIVGPHFSDMTYRYIDDDNDTYTYIETMDLVWPVLDDLRIRIEASGVKA
ncbi:hypothetical protein C8J31_10813 [Rhizobium sp. PP-CC-2G-626]|nr:hypothetical protein C8J31_10813 [Rhizobium sp. PP-CC-2G-626]